MSVLDADRRPGGSGALPGVADAQRLDVLQRTGLLDHEADATVDAFARLAAALLDAPAAFVTLVGAEEQVAPGAVQLDRPAGSGRSIPIRESLCQFTVATGEPLVLPDTQANPLVQAKPAVRNGTVLAYAGVPLRTSGGFVLGSLCVHDRHARQWSDEQIALLRDLAGLVARDIEHRLTTGRIVGVRGLGRRTAEEVGALSDAVRSLVELAEQQDDPRLQRYAALARSRTGRVDALAAELAEAAAPVELVHAEGPGAVDLRRMVQRAVAAAPDATDTQALTLDLPAEVLVVSCDAVQLERALVHLLVSALQHTVDGESLRVRLARSAGSAPDGGARAELTVRGLGTQIPAAELGRIVARFHQAMCAQSSTQRPAALRMVGGEVEARSGAVLGRSSRHGLAFQVEWELHDEPGVRVIDLR